MNWPAILVGVVVLASASWFLFAPTVPELDERSLGLEGAGLKFNVKSIRPSPSTAVPVASPANASVDTRGRALVNIAHGKPVDHVPSIIPIAGRVLA